MFPKSYNLINNISLIGLPNVKRFEKQDCPGPAQQKAGDLIQASQQYLYNSSSINMLPAGYKGKNPTK